jgi:ribosomal protein L7/L12
MPGAYSQESLEAHFKQTNERLRLIEQQLAVLSEKAGVEYTMPNADVSQDVVDLAQSGDVLGAVKRYRELTGASAEEAQTVVQGL